MSEESPKILTSPALTNLGVPHFFSTRHAGDMAAAAAAEAFAGMLTPGTRRLQRAKQVHGAAVITVDGSIQDHVPDADGLVTRDPASVVAVRTADCVPVLLSTDDGKVVAAVHAGWRGVVAGVAPAAIRSMRALSGRPLVAAIGPCISAPAFEVGPEVVAEFRRVFGQRAEAFLSAGRNDRSHIDLVAALKLQMGPLVQTIDTTATHCTLGRSDLFYSHRRDAAAAGRMLSGIGVR